MGLFTRPRSPYWLGRDLHFAKVPAFDVSKPMAVRTEPADVQRARVVLVMGYSLRISAAFARSLDEPTRTNRSEHLRTSRQLKTHRRSAPPPRFHVGSVTIRIAMIVAHVLPVVRSILQPPCSHSGSRTCDADVLWFRQTLRGCDQNSTACTARPWADDVFCHSTQH